jgi:copper(I)-binding protein
MPAEVRGAWLELVVAPYARQHPEDAATWISQFQSEPGYERILQQLIVTSAQTDPQNAARMLQVAPAGLQAQSAVMIASAWVREDIAGAARWAVNVADNQARGNAVRSVAGAWATRDPAAAQRWALGLPPGETRDAALLAIVQRFSRPDFRVEIDERIIDAFESEQVRAMAQGMTAAGAALR